MQKDGRLVRWKLVGEDLYAQIRTPDGSKSQVLDNGRWVAGPNGASTFWGVDTDNHVVLWEKGAGKKVWTFIMGSGWKQTSGGPLEYIPLKKGFIRGREDPR